MRRITVVGSLFFCAAALADNRPPLQLGVPTRDDPIEYCQVVEVNGEVVQLTDWIPYEAGPGVGNDGGGVIASTTCTPVTYGICPGFDDTLLFDSFEPDSLGNPSTTDECGLAGSRWYHGGTYLNSYCVGDFTLCSGGGASAAHGIDFQMSWGAGVLRPRYMWVQTFDTFTPCSSAPPGATGPHEAWIFHFADNAGPRLSFSHLNLACSTGLWTLPADGSGAILWKYGNYVSPTFTPDTTPGTQPFLWGTSATRPGSQTDEQWDDDTPANGTHNAGECGGETGTIPCPAIVGMAFAIRGHVVACNPCDTNHDGTVNLGDIDPFVALLNVGGHPTGCTGDTNGDGTINLGDIDSFVACLNAP